MPSELSNEEKIPQPLIPIPENQYVMHPRVLGQSARESFTDYANSRENIIRVAEGDDIQKALDNLEAVGGGILHFKTGIHRLQKGFVIPAFVTVEGEGQDNTRLDFEDRNLQITVVGTASSPVKNVRLRDLTVERSGHATSAVQFSFATHFIIDNVRFSDNTGNGVRIVACQQYTFFNCLSDNNGDDGYDLDGSGTTLQHAAFNYISCNATGNTGNGFAIFGDINNQVKAGTFVGCFSSGNTTDGYDINTGIEVTVSMHGCYGGNNGGIGFDINSNDVKIMGCFAEDNTGDGIEISKTGCSVIGTLTEGNGTDTDYSVAVDTGGSGTSSLARAYRSATQSINSGSSTKVQLNNESYDTGSNFDSTTNYRYTAPSTGYYHMNAAARIVDLADGKFFVVSIKKNGTTVLCTAVADSGHANSNISAYISDVQALTANDYIELFVEHDHGSARDLHGNGDQVFMSVSLVST